MRSAFPGTEPTTRILEHVDDEAELAALTARLLGKQSVIVLKNAPNALYVFREASVASPKAGLCVVPDYISASAAYVADPVTAPGRWENILGGSSAPALLAADLVSTGNLAGARTGNVLLASANGALGALDGVTVEVGMQLLLVGQTTGANNGLWVVTSVGGSSAKWRFARAPGADSSSEFAAGQQIFVKSGVAYAGQRFYLATTGAIALNTTALSYKVVQSTNTHEVAVCCTSNMSLTAFIGVTGGTAQDGVTCVAGDRVLLVGQTTPAENGIYVVGAVAAGVAPLTRAHDWAVTNVQPAGADIRVTGGTAWKNIVWFASAGAVTPGTTNPLFYPRRYTGTSGALAGTPGTLAITSQWILHATNSRVFLTRKAPAGTTGNLSFGTLTAGAGDGSFTITSTGNETSTVAYEIVN